MKIARDFFGLRYILARWLHFTITKQTTVFNRKLKIVDFLFYRYIMSGLKFSAQKLAAFSGQDLSRKGSVDEAIQDLVTYINSLDQYFTTRFVLECSPTIILIFSGQSITINKSA